MVPKYLNSEDAAAHVRSKFGRPCTSNLLTKLASRGGGPRFVKIARFRAYTVEWLDEWAEAQVSEPMTSTSDKLSPELVERIKKTKRSTAIDSDRAA